VEEKGEEKRGKTTNLRTLSLWRGRELLSASCEGRRGRGKGGKAGERRTLGYTVGENPGKLLVLAQEHS
jgi:hypothetical protein